MLKITRLAPWRAETDPWTLLLFSSFSHWLQGVRCFGPATPDGSPSPPENSALVLLMATEWKVRTQDSVLPPACVPFIKHKVLSHHVAFSSLPKGRQESSLQGIVQGIRDRGGGGVIATLCPTSFQSHLAANRVASELLCYLFWGLGCGSMGPSNANVFLS